MELSGISCVTTELAPTSTLFPKVTAPKIFAPAQIILLLPIFGANPLARDVVPKSYSLVYSTIFSYHTFTINNNT